MYKEYFNQAELALAAYANNLDMGTEINTKLKNAGFSEVQADIFIDNYTIITQYPDGTR